MDQATWAALTAALTVLGAIWTWTAYRRHGLGSGLRALGVTLLPMAAWLTGTLRLATKIGTAVADWATSLVFNPLTWGGIGLAGVSVVLWVVGGILRDREISRGKSAGEVTSTRSKRLPPTDRSTGGSPVDDDMADIEALLKKRGIT